ncbi:MAG TPA: hypothetical protein O0W81_00950 [Methanocorpusculum sp.]|nr:hypothetical protein [Methanocorpusculum sp.]
MQNGKKEENLADYKKAAEQSSKNYLKRYEIAESETKSRMYEIAIQIYMQALAIRNINGDVWVGTAYDLSDAKP